MAHLLAPPSHTDATSLLPLRRYRFVAAVVLIQGVHVVEHTIQLLQVAVFNVPDDDALGLLGYVLQFNGTEEWLHLAFNLAYLVAIYVIAFFIVPLVRLRRIPRRVLVPFLGLGVVLETWHIVEHMVIMNHVIHNHGCPCPGIGDQALGISDTYLHFVYNSLTFIGSIVLFRFLRTVAGPRMYVDATR